MVKVSAAEKALQAETSIFDFKVTPSTVQKGAVEKLRSAIIGGVFKPGDRLVEASLCDLLGISRPSVREALRSLEAEKLIEIIPNRGPFVRRIEWPEAEAIYNVRAVLEGEAAALFAQRCQPEEIVALRHALEAFEAAVAVENVSQQVVHAGQFYTIIFRGCGNIIMEDILSGLLARISSLRQRSMSRSGRSLQSEQEMHNIYRAIAEGDAKSAKQTAIDHVYRAKGAAKLSFSEAEAESEGFTKPRRKRLKA